MRVLLGALALSIVGLSLAQTQALLTTKERLIVHGELKTYTGTRAYTIASEEELMALLPRLERAPKNARFVFDAQRGWYAVDKLGYRFDRDAVRRAYHRALAYGKASFYLPVHYLEPERGVPALFAAGIRELVGEGESSFLGSSWGRIQNIKLAARRLDGRVIPQGAVFSFNQALGPVDEKTGYKESYVILGDRTEKGVGGGVCQVSTTVFRAAFFAGLPILERHNHSYQLRYYRPTGLDATVYAPWVDLKFKNDTPGDLLLRTFVRGHRLVVRLFGTRDRTVTWKGPVVLKTTPPLPPREIPDPSLPPGTRRRVDWAVPGAQVYVLRRVAYDGGETVEERFFSRYKPWGDIYLVGPPAEAEAP